MDRIFAKGRYFVDEEGRQRIFNGINLVHKGELEEGAVRKNYIPDWQPEVFDLLVKNGFNVARLGLIWDAVEPEPGQYDDDYLSHMGRYIDLCAERGIYVFLDMHQDLYAAEFSDGAPAWATVTDSYKYTPPKKIWAEGYYFSKAVQKSFDNFWKNTPVNGKGLQDHYCDMWKYVVRFYSDKTNILGYDVMNEPYPGTNGGYIFKNLIKKGIKVIGSNDVPKLKTLFNIITGDTVLQALGVLSDPKVFKKIGEGGELLSEQFDVNDYYPFLRKVSAAIRSVDKNGVIFMENNYYSNIGIPCLTPRLTYENGEVESNLAFTPHGYDLVVDSEYTNRADTNRVKYIFSRHLETQQRLQVPVLVGEWGGMVGGADEYPALESMIDMFDNNKWSQTYWCYYDGLFDTKIPSLICRPYPRAVPGEIVNYKFDRANRSFTLIFDAGKKPSAKADIFVPFQPAKITANGKYHIKKEKNETTTVTVAPVPGLNTVYIDF